MFERWLVLWREATDAEMPAEVATSMQLKAERIAQSFRFALGLEPARVWSEGDAS
jgi:hemoglobin